MTDKEDGSILGGHRARRKLGGPEMYSVAKRALTAGLPGNRYAKILDVRLDSSGLVATL
jgi:hypothetical protein